MAVRNDLTDQANDKLLVKVLNIMAIEPLYRRRESDSALTLVSVRVHVSALPGNSDQSAAIVAWAAGKCNVKPDMVDLELWTGGDDDHISRV